MISEEEVIGATHYGLNIYSHILRSYYPQQIVLELKGQECSHTRNPFNHDKPTLYLWKEDGMFFYNDTELEGFKGNPLDFAFLHFGLSGQPLLERLVRDMCLVVGAPQSGGESISPQWAEGDSPLFSCYHAPISNVQPAAEITLLTAYQAIRGHRYDYFTRELRMITREDQRRRYKARFLDYVTFSGTFLIRGEKYLKKHSGLITLDFDDVNNIPQLMSSLLNDGIFETQLMFISPSGHGVKWVVDVDLSIRGHLDWFNGLSQYLWMKYQLEVDRSGKDVSRACYLCHDPKVYIHPKYLHG